MFSEERVTHMAAYLLKKEGGRMSYLKLLKLLYLAERKAMAKWGESISGDHFVSMPHGPVLSQTYDLIQGTSEALSPWQKMIQDKDNYEVSLRHDIVIDDLDELSPSEIKILEETFDEFGHMGRFQIRDYTHDNCPEWEDPKGSSYPIKPENIFRAMGKSNGQITSLMGFHREQAQLDITKSLLA
jgi:uncharacterized phage-associated protein